MILRYWWRVLCFAFAPLYLFNRSSSYNTQNYYTDNSNTAAQAEGGSALAIHGSQNQVSLEVVDHGAVQGGLALAGKSLDVNAELIDAYGGIVDKVVATQERLIQGNAARSVEFANDLRSFAEVATLGQSERDRMTQYLILGAAVLVVGLGMWRRRP